MLCRDKRSLLPAPNPLRSAPIPTVQLDNTGNLQDGPTGASIQVTTHPGEGQQPQER